jgi:hypothetical protein
MTPIIAALRPMSQLKESLLHTAQELAHRASIYGITRVSLCYLAKKCHCCKQTIINHINLLIKYGVIKKFPLVKVKGNFFETGRYRFLIHWEGKPVKLRPKPAQMCNSQNFGHNLPPQEKREKSAGKWGRIHEEIAQLKKGLWVLTQGSEPYEATQERIRYLQSVQRE